MVVEHEFTVPVPAGQVWPVLCDLERIFSCVPGVTLAAVTGREVEGRFRVRAGSVTVTYLGTARFAESDEGEHRLVVVVAGRQARGTGTVDATIAVRLHDSDEGTRVRLSTDVTVTGRLTLVDHGVLVGVGTRMLTRFAGRLTGLLTTPAADLVTDPGVDPGAEPVAGSATVRRADSGATTETTTETGPPERRPVARAAHPTHGPVTDGSRGRPEPADAPALRWAARSLAVLALLVLLVRRRRRRARANR